MVTTQPTWRPIANLGDDDPLAGAYCVYTDDTGTYEAEAEIVMPPPDTDDDDPSARWDVYRFSLDRCTYTGGVLSDNPYHPDRPAWFADSLPGVADSIGEDTDGLIADLCSGDPIARAFAYRTIGDYHGWENLDQYPLSLTLAGMRARYPD